MIFFVRFAMFLTFCALLLWPVEFSSALSLDAGAFGLGELQPGEDATPVLRRAMEACRNQGATGLRLPPGTYHLYPDHAFERHLAVANNNPGVKRVVFLLDHLNGFTLEGQNTQLVCHGPMIPISVDDAEGVTLKGFSIDWVRPFHFEGRVIAIHPEQSAFDLQVHDEVIYEIRNKRLIFRQRKSPSPNAWKEWAPPPTQQMAWEHNLQWNMWFDGETGHPIPGEHQWAVEPDPPVVEQRPGVIRIFDAVQQPPQVGWVLTVKGMMSPNRTSPAIRVARSKQILLEDLSIHHAGGMGVIMQRCEDVTLRRFAVSLPPNKQRMVTTTADATHFNGCRGDILIEDCTFENMLDDATNIHGCFVRVEKQLTPRKLLCRRVHSQQRGLIVMERKDQVRFVTSADLQSYADAEVVETRELNSDLFEVTLDRLPEGGIREGSGLYNTTWQPDFTIRRCTVRNHRARTMLIATAGDVLIEENLFEHSSMAGIQCEGDNGFWWESGPTRNVVIRDNTFRNNAGAALRIVPQIDTDRFPNALYHGGIVFEGNVIETFHRRVVEGRAIDGLVFRKNTLRMTDDVQPVDKSASSFAFETGRNLLLEENEFLGEPPMTVEIGNALNPPIIRQNVGITTLQRAAGGE